LPIAEPSQGSIRNPQSQICNGLAAVILDDQLLVQRQIHGLAFGRSEHTTGRQAVDLPLNEQLIVEYYSR